MQIKEIHSKENWESFLAECHQKTFMQSWQWGEFHKRMGDKIWRLGVYEAEQLAGIALVVKVSAKRGTFLMLEHGPVAKKADIQIVEAVLDKVKELAKQENAAFLRVSPIWERNTQNQGMFRGLGFREAPTYAATESSWRLDITPTEDDLLKNMRKTTRYLIRQTLKRPTIQVVRSTDKKDLEIFAALQREVSQRQQFVPFSRTFTENEFDVFAEGKQISFFFGKVKDEVAAAALVVFWSGIAFYHQAGSLSKFSKLSIPYRIQWEVIREAKRRGCKMYDFWGYMDPKAHPKHPWAGPTLFKMGFGGEATEYVKTQDYPLSLKYWPTAIFEMIRAKKRGL